MTDGKAGKEPAKLAKTSNLTTSASATVVSARPRTALTKTHSVQDAREPSNRPTKSAAVTKPVILIESETLEEDELEQGDDINGGMEVDVNGDDAAFSTALLNKHRDDQSETDEDEDFEDPDDWVRMMPDEAEEAADMLEDVRTTFVDDVDLFDTTMVAEYAEDIFHYMEKLEVRSLQSFVWRVTAS